MTTYHRNAFHPFEGLAESCTMSEGGPHIETAPVYGMLVVLKRVQRWKLGAVTMFPADPLPTDGLVF